MKTEALLTPHMISSLKPKAKDYTVFDAGCAGLALRVQPKGARSWICWERKNGKTRRITLGRLCDLSLDPARDAVRLRQAGVITPPKPETRLTFGQLAKRFLAAKNGDYTQRTRDGIKSYLDTQLLPQFGKTPLHRITTPALADWFYRYSQTRSGGANAALIHFTTIWNWGRAEQFVPKGLPNPAKPIKKNVRAPVGRMINTADLKRLAEAPNDPPIRTREAAEAVRLILLTGCRSGEIFRLTWNEVKRDRLKLKRTKTGPRTVMLSSEAKDVLDARRRDRCSDFVFPSPFDPMRPRGSIHGAWMTIKRLAGLPETLRPHDLRHTYASHAILAGESLYATGKLLGHRSASSTEQYTHLEGKVLAKVADQVAAKIERWMEG